MHEKLNRMALNSTVKDLLQDTENCLHKNQINNFEIMRSSSLHEEEWALRSAIIQQVLA